MHFNKQDFIYFIIYFIWLLYHLIPHKRGLWVVYKAKIYSQIWRNIYLALSGTITWIPSPFSLHSGSFWQLEIYHYLSSNQKKLYQSFFNLPLSVMSTQHWPEKEIYGRFICVCIYLLEHFFVIFFLLRTPRMTCRIFQTNPFKPRKHIYIWVGLGLLGCLHKLQLLSHIPKFLWPLFFSSYLLGFFHYRRRPLTTGSCFLLLLGTLEGENVGREVLSWCCNITSGGMIWY